MRGVAIEIVRVAVDDIGPSHLIDHLSWQFSTLTTGDGTVVVGMQSVVEIYDRGRGTAEAVYVVLDTEFCDFLLADSVQLELAELVSVGLLVMRGEFTWPIAEDQATLCSFSFDSLCVFGTELILGFGVVGLLTHTYDNVTVSAVLTNWLCLLCFLFCEVVSITRLEVVVRIVSQLDVDWFLALNLDGSQWLLVVMRLRLGEIGGDLLRESELEVRTLEIQHSVLVYCLLCAVFMTELRLGLRVELSAIGTEADVRPIVSSFTGIGLNRFSIMRCCIGGEKVTLIITQHQVSVSK